MSETQSITSMLDFNGATVHVVFVTAAVRLSQGWQKTIPKSIKLKVKPTPEQIELICDLVDWLHDNELSDEGHSLDSAMCDWAALLLDA